MWYANAHLQLDRLMVVRLHLAERLDELQRIGVVLQARIADGQIVDVVALAGRVTLAHVLEQHDALAHVGGVLGAHQRPGVLELRLERDLVALLQFAVVLLLEALCGMDTTGNILSICFGDCVWRYFVRLYSGDLRSCSRRCVDVARELFGV